MIVFWSTSEGNPAIRSDTGSIYLQYFFMCLNQLDPFKHDVNDLQRWLNQCFDNQTFKIDKNKKIFICPTMQSTLKKILRL